jgi:hypothetical protein
MCASSARLEVTSRSPLDERGREVVELVDAAEVPVRVEVDAAQLDALGARALALDAQEALQHEDVRVHAERLRDAAHACLDERRRLRRPVEGGAEVDEELGDRRPARLGLLEAGWRGRAGPGCHVHCGAASASRSVMSP